MVQVVIVGTIWRRVKLMFVHRNSESNTMDIVHAYRLLNTGQRRAFDAVMDGNNVFITGPGGTGKSFLIKILLECMPKERKTGVVALTGCAALLLGCKAKTLHSWAGIGLGKESVEALVASIKKKSWKPSLRNWLQTKTLIIDEVSMMTPELFEKLDAIGRRIRGSSQPFGGIQIVLIGDFYQLPPVAANSEIRFLFQSRLWNDVIHKTIQLEEIVRQKDPVFQGLLNAARVGRLEKEHVAILESRCDLPWRDQEIRPTLLFSRRREVDMINTANLEALEGETHIYRPRTEVEAAGRNITDEAITAFDKDSPYDEELTLRVGAQVMLIYNVSLEDGLVNGSRGVVRRFARSEGELIPVVLFKNGKEVGVGRAKWEIDDYKGVSRSQIPLRLAYAVTIHKCQGATLDSALIDIGINVFEFGQAYVALSRVRSLDSLYVWALDPRAIQAHPAALTYYKGLTVEESRLEPRPVEEETVAAAVETEDPQVRQDN